MAHGVSLCKELETKMVLLHIAKTDKEARDAKKKMDVLSRCHTEQEWSCYQCDGPGW